MPMDTRRLFLPLAVIAFLFPSFAHAEVIRDFHVDATMDSERNLSVTETITYDFEDAERHGIYRNIPVRYTRDGAGYDLHLKGISASMDGKAVPFSTTYGDGDIIVKIGDPNKTITGPHTYAITYATNRAINFFEAHSELYWNVTGNGWPVVIEKASMSVGMPPVPFRFSATSTCYTGPIGSVAGDCEASSVDRYVTFRSTRVLLPGEGMTIVLGMPAGVIRAPTALERFWMLLRDNVVLALPLFTLFWMAYLWRMYGKDPAIPTIIPEYESPEGLPPADLTCILTSGFVTTHGITATLLDLARRGYLHVRFGEKKKLIGTEQTYTLVKVKDADEKLPAPERALATALFKGGDELKLEEFRNRQLYTNIATFREEVKKRLKEKKLFSMAWYSQRWVYVVGAVVWAWMAIFFFPSEPLGMLAGLLSAVPILAFGLAMQQRTPKGAAMFAKVKGFEYFMSVAEKDRIAFHNAPERTPTQFLELLPYAIALGVEKQWAKQFQGIDIPPPEWAENYPTGSFRATSYSSAFSAIHTAASSGYSAPSSSGSGGSGRSGGGFGGGGGGSW
jgi:uncharacterized membrane protein